MLESEDYAQLDNESPFLGGLIDKYNAHEKLSSITSVFCNCFHVVSIMFCENMLLGWFWMELGDISRLSNKFKEITTDVSQKYQASKMGATNVHRIKHLFCYKNGSYYIVHDGWSTQ